MRWDDPALHKLAGEFFRMFSRMEYALKATGYLVPSQRNAEADWTKFAIDIHENFANIATEQLGKATTFLLTEPPKKQINNNGVVEWDPTPPDAKNQTHLLLRYVCRIRNNLFHGGKFNGRWFEPERSGPLIQEGIEVLSACLQVSEKVNAAYHS